MFKTMVAVTLFSLFSFGVYANDRSNSPLTVQILQAITDRPSLSPPKQWQQLRHYSRQNYQQFRGSHRQIYRGSRSQFRKGIQNYNNGYYQRGNIYNTPYRSYNSKFIRGNIYITPNIYQQKYQRLKHRNRYFDD